MEFGSNRLGSKFQLARCSVEILLEHVGRGFLNVLLISMPVVLTAASIGLVVGILQAVTQVQEQTIAAAPKILGVFLILIMMGGFTTKVLKEYLINSINMGMKIIPKNDEYVLPHDAELINKNNFFGKEQKHFNSGKTPDINKLMQSPGKIPYIDKKQDPSITKSNRTPNSKPTLIEKKKIYTGK